MTKDLPPVSNILKQKNIPHQVFIHPGPLHSLEQAAKERGQSPQQIVRSILFRIAKGNYLMVLVAGPEQIEWKILRNKLRANRMTMASEEEVLSVTGYPLGAVAPFGLPLPIKIIVDQSVLEQQVVSMGSGIRGIGIILKSEDLIQALGDHQVENLRNP
jgi:Cys-tRNA(Pro)/Cys-tRNA(Cys) deacylase